MNYKFIVINKDEELASFVIDKELTLIEYNVKNSFVEKILNLSNNIRSVQAFLESRSNYKLSNIEEFVSFMTIFKGVVAKDDYFILVKEVENAYTV